MLTATQQITMAFGAAIFGSVQAVLLADLTMWPAGDTADAGIGGIGLEV